MSDTPTPEGPTTAFEQPSTDALFVSALGYLPVLFFVPLFLGTKEPFAKFHGRQSLVMFAAVVIFNIMVAITDLILGRALGGMFLIGFFFKAVAWLIHYPAGFVVALAYLILMIYGMVQAGTGQYTRIPVVGAYAERLRI